MDDDLAAKMAEVMAGLSEGIEPVVEAAIGLRARLEREGWSPTAAEQAALQMLCTTLSLLSKS